MTNEKLLSKYPGFTITTSDKRVLAVKISSDIGKKEVISKDYKLQLA